MVGFIDKYKQGYTLAETDSGLGVIEYTDQKIKEGFISDIDYDVFDKNRKKLLNIID
jgi:hypothetical protein